MSIEKKAFGSAEAYTVCGKGDLSITVLTYGATLQSICYKGVDVALGYNTLEEYRTNDGYLGATVGRYANRIAGGKFTLNGVEYDVGCNEEGRGHLHGGKIGLSAKIWDAEILDETTLRLTNTLADGEEGYPGNMEVAVLFAVDGDTLRITYQAKTDRDTVYNPTNHCYFNLNGDTGAEILNHLMKVNADAYTVLDEVLIPTGELRPVEGTPFDFSKAKPIGQDIAAKDPQLAIGAGYDHNFCIPGEGLRTAVVLRSPDTGIEMICRTDLPGVQIYTGNCTGDRAGKRGPIGKHSGVCLETQFYPDSPNHPAFPSATLKAGDEFTSVTEYSFSK